MLQRRQTIYLLAMGLVIAGMLIGNSVFYTVEGTVTSQDQTFEEMVMVGFRAASTEKGGELLMMNTLVYVEAIIGLLSLAIIFLYKNRPLQIRLSVVNFVIILGLFVLMYLSSFGTEYLDEVKSQNLEYPALIPISLLLLNFLAIRRIQADEKLVNSLNRLR